MASLQGGRRLRRRRRGRRPRSTPGIGGRGFGAGVAAKSLLPLAKRFVVPFIKKAVLPGLASAGIEAGFRKLFQGKGRRRRRR